MPRLLLSEITCMRPGLRCIAGYLLDQRRMVRPLNPDGALHWSEDAIAEIGWIVGGVYDVRTVSHAPTRGLPHVREDLFVDPACVRLIEELDDEAVCRLLRPTVSRSLAGLFGENLVEDKYVEDGADCPSLGAIELPTREVRFRYSYDKLSCVFESDGVLRWLKVKSWALSEVNSERGAAALQARVRRHPRVHLRIGLPNPWDKYDPGRCYPMVNGVLLP